MPHCKYCSRPTPDPQDPHLRDREVAHYDSRGYVVCLRERCQTLRVLSEARDAVNLPRVPTRTERAIMDDLQRELMGYE